MVGLKSWVFTFFAPILHKLSIHPEPERKFTKTDIVYWWVASALTIPRQQVEPLRRPHLRGCMHFCWAQTMGHGRDFECVLSSTWEWAPWDSLVLLIVSWVQLVGWTSSVLRPRYRCEHWGRHWGRRGHHVLAAIFAGIDAFATDANFLHAQYPTISKISIKVYIISDR